MKIANKEDGAKHAPSNTNSAIPEPGARPRGCLVPADGPDSAVFTSDALDSIR